jgi:single-strand DNA-binding protein
MANLNKVMLIGNLTRDPELRVTPKGTAICTFSLAVNRKFRDESGADREEVTYVDIEAWGKSGENISKYCTKGRPLFVEGRLRLDQWEDKNTKEKRSRMKVVCENFQFLGSGRGDGAAAGAGPAAEGGAAGGGGERRYSAPPPRSAPTGNAAPQGQQENLDEDVPF